MLGTSLFSLLAEPPHRAPHLERLDDLLCLFLFYMGEQFIFIFIFIIIIFFSSRSIRIDDIRYSVSNRISYTM